MNGVNCHRAGSCPRARLACSYLHGELPGKPPLLRWGHLRSRSGWWLGTV